MQEGEGTYNWLQSNQCTTLSKDPLRGDSQIHERQGGRPWVEDNRPGMSEKGFSD